MNLTELKEYYSNLLIVQYNNKPKAKATIEALIGLLYANLLLVAVRDAFNVDTAVGEQLDFIGEWVGVSRLFRGQLFTDTYFAFCTYDDESISSNQAGFSNYSDYETKPGQWLLSRDVVSLTNKLNDDDFRILIKLKIISNNINHSHYAIDEAIYNLFGDSVYYSDNQNMTVDVNCPLQYKSIIDIAIQKDVMPRPAGVKLILQEITST